MCKWGTEVMLDVWVNASQSHTGVGYMKRVGIDACIAPIIAALNAHGIVTTGSCCGHGKQDGSVLMADGRRLVIKSPESIASTPEAFCRYGHLAELRAAHTQTEEKPKQLWVCNKCGYAGKKGPLHSGCNYHAAFVPARPERQEPRKHERILYFYGRPGGPPGNGWRCSCGSSWPCPQAPEKEKP